MKSAMLPIFRKATLIFNVYYILFVSFFQIFTACFFQHVTHYGYQPHKTIIQIYSHEINDFHNVFYLEDRKKKNREFRQHTYLLVIFIGTYTSKKPAKAESLEFNPVLPGGRNQSHEVSLNCCVLGTDTKCFNKRHSYPN